MSDASMPAMLCRAHVPVLAAWGASDWLSSREDHLLLAACANEGKAGLGSFVEIQGADHYFAARAFEDGAQRVGGAAQPARQRLGEIDRDELGVDVVHRRQHAFGLGHSIAPDQIEAAAAQFTGRFRQPVEIGRFIDFDVIRRRDGLAAHDGEYHARFGQFFQRVLRVAGVVQRGMGQDVGLHRRCGLAGRGQQVARVVVLFTMHRADRQRAVANELARSIQGQITRGVAKGKRRADFFDDAVEVVHGCPSFIIRLSPSFPRAFGGNPE
ncbi:MAG: hypothetical protein WCJ30_07795 [Deltaproteobacteria bacterium]